MIDRFERFVSVITGINRNLHRIMTEEMEKYGLKGSYAIYLVAMHRHPEGVTGARLCEICDRNKAAVSRALTELLHKRLIRREGGYRARLYLTEDGKKAAIFVCERATVAVDHAGRGLSEEERTQFYKTIDAIAENLDTFGSKGLPC